MKNILIICDNINEITRLKKHFGEEFKVSASNSAENAYSVMQNRLLDLAVYHVGSDMAKLLAFYKSVRKTPKTENLNLVFIADESMKAVLNDVAALENASVISDPNLLKSLFADV